MEMVVKTEKKLRKRKVGERHEGDGGEHGEAGLEEAAGGEVAQHEQGGEQDAEGAEDEGDEEDGAAPAAAKEVAPADETFD